MQLAVLFQDQAGVLVHWRFNRNDLDVAVACARSTEAATAGLLELSGTTQIISAANAFSAAAATSTIHRECPPERDHVQNIRTYWVTVNTQSQRRERSGITQGS